MEQVSLLTQDMLASRKKFRTMVNSTEDSDEDSGRSASVLCELYGPVVAWNVNAPRNLKEERNCAQSERLDSGDTA